MSKTRRDDYFSLVQAFPLRRIQNDGDHSEALRASGRLIGLTRKLTFGERQYLDALVVLIREYEQAHHDPKLSTASGIEVLKHLMAERRMTQRELAKLLGIGVSAVSMILSGARDLTKSHISVLSRHFGVAVTAFFG